MTAFGDLGGRDSINGLQRNVRALWAKSEPFHPLWCHLIDVAVVARAVAKRFGGVPNLPDSWVALVAGLHDLGKADAWFQNKSPELASQLERQGVDLPNREASVTDHQRRFRHEARSADWVQEWLLETAGWGCLAAPPVAMAIRGHHGDFQPKYCYEEDRGVSQLFWDTCRQELLEMLLRVLKPPTCQIDRFLNASEVGAKLSGIVVFADWIASNPEIYRFEKLPTTDEPDAYYRAATGEAQNALSRLRLDSFPEAVAASKVPSFREVWSGAELNGKLLRPMQQKLEELCQQFKLLPGLAIIEAPMGEGKTEAAVYLAECWNQMTGRSGCYLALPTQATANQIHLRYRRFLATRRPEASAPSLVHGMSWLVDDVSPVAAPQTFDDSESNKVDQLARDWFRPARRALLADDAVGTVDQALMAALNVKFGFLRLLGLTSKTLVIDEVHAYDEYMTTIMKRLLEWCRTLKINVILLSATLSLRQKQSLCESYAGKERRDQVVALLGQSEPRLTPYPLFTFVPIDGPAEAVPIEADPSRSRQISLRLHPGLLENFETTAELAIEVVKHGGCVCVLANTVRAAQAIFEVLSERCRSGVFPEIELFLFHARFPASRRNAIEERVTTLFGKDAQRSRPVRAILVATQVVEQSLDVDFDVMLSQIAPVDLLLQRIGRLWRHNRVSAERHGITGPVLHILLPPAGELKFNATERVYEREVLLRTSSLLRERTHFDLPREFRSLIEGCYGRGPLPNSMVSRDELEKAEIHRKQKQAVERAKARTHLLPEPSRHEFNPVRPAADEGEGDAYSYFVAQTRLGDESVSVLLIEDHELFTLARLSLDSKSKPPPREKLKVLFLQKVGLPRWWLMSVDRKTQRGEPCEALEGFDSFFTGEGWLSQQLVLPLKGGEWHGRDGNGQTFVIRNDEILGVTRRTLISKKETLHGEEEADAGQLG